MNENDNDIDKNNTNIRNYEISKNSENKNYIEFENKKIKN